MNLVGTLAKVALGVMVSRGVGKLIGGGSSQQDQQQLQGGGGLGGLLGGLTGGAGGGGGLGGLLGGLAGGAAQGGGGGGLGGLLGGLTGGSGQSSGGGLGGLLSGLSGSQQQGGGGVGDLLGGALAGGAGGGLGGLLDGLGGGQQQGGGLGGMFNQALSGQSIPEPEPDQNAQAEIMLRGMINAAKSDGQIDQDEQAKIIEHLGDVTQEEIDFVRNEMAQPLDVDGFIRSVPSGLEQQVYMMSLLGIQLDSQAEAQYLDRLAQGMGISQEAVNQIHAQVGVPNLYG